ncbi:hypothetical protein O3M35_012538 [Rhynocoris fuscipes]|uniref:J domain-containing protein n=1 Tax=Rhynocoris fuscipes TaxID=488301 RepID=A0AAW1CU65_9HEMI
MMCIRKKLYDPLVFVFLTQHLRRNFSGNSDVKIWYKILGVAENSDQETVRVAYLDMVKRYHPDSKSEEADANKFLEIESAYRNLQDKFARERFNKNDCEGEYGLYHVDNEGVVQYDIDHTAPQHRQYLSFDGIGSGTPSQREKQFTKLKASRAAEKVTSYKIRKLQESDSKSLTERENKRKAKDIKTRYGIERLVEDLIQEAMNKGEFDNLKGSGKPLKNIKRTHNPYVDFVTHKMNEVLIDNGFAPSWINLQKEITEEKEKIKTTLANNRMKLGVLPLTRDECKCWEEIKKDLETEVKALNQKIDFYNLVVPLLNKQQFHFNLEKEAEKILLTGKACEKREK